MGTRGYSIIRYRGRYYCFYSGADSMPDALGKSIVNQIPEDPQAYQAWLAAERTKAAKWDKAVQDTLEVERDCINNGEDKDCSQGSETSSNNFSPWQLYGPDVDRFPSYVPEFNDLFYEWMYVVDLDREVFTVDHAVHFKLDKILRHDWANSLGVSDNLLLRLDPPAAENLRMYTDLNAKIVTARDIKDFPPSLRHGPILYARIFQMYQRQQKSVLSHLLLGWEPSELHFREMVYAILCFASAGSSSVELKRRIMRQQGIDVGEESDEHLSSDDRAELDSCHPASIFNSTNNALDRYLGRDMATTEPTFMALVSLLDATARQQLPKSKPVERRLPTEIYRFMIANIVDFETYCACKMVSRNFRDLCQENLRIGNNAVTVVPNPDTRSYTQVPESTMVIHTGIIDRASEHDVDFPLRAGRRGSGQNGVDEATWQIVIGSEPGRRSMICGLEVAFGPVLW
ncbi:MAG: hypothetical protein ASARMPRED_007583 [Alectoria sarmentosa]|nr:MAG: hypothetical protein ASARMPRED_007583 [Alectoria sarmentosa]